MWKIVLWIAIVYLIVGIVVALISKDWLKGLFWIFYIFDDIDFPDGGIDFDLD